MTTPIDGPRLPPHTGEAPTALVVLLHGYGADGRDLIDLGPEWAAQVPGAAFVAPHAPNPCGMAPMGREWFPYILRDDRERWIGVEAAHAGLNRFLDEELARYGLSGDRLALVGFSQGTMVALHTGLRRAVPPAAILGYAGLHALPSERELEAADAAITSRPPTLLIHGDADEVVPVEALARSVHSLTERDVPVEWHVAAGLGHGIDAEGVRLGGLFLARHLTGG